jgi:hypothetical protein
LAGLALDGTKVKANASRHKAMSYDRMTAEEERLQKEIDELLAKAQAADEAEDEIHGERRGDELPEELARRETRLQKIREAKAALEEQARKKAAAHAENSKRRAARRAKIPVEAVPKPKDQRNFTDPESKIMKTSNKGFDQCGNAQAVANEDQVIVAADVTDQANDAQQVEPMVEQTVENLDRRRCGRQGRRRSRPTPVTSAKRTWNRWSERTDRRSVRRHRPFETSRASARRSEGSPAEESDGEGEDGPQAANEERQQRIRRRKAMIEPPFGQIKHCRGFGQFLLRGLEQMQGEWRLVCLTHNLLKIFRHGALGVPVPHRERSSQVARYGTRTAS